MNISQRIQLSSGATNADKYIKVQLEQNIDTLEFLSMNLETKDIYQDFNADYGVLIGRVTANGGVGVPNAKISIFIPLTDIDAENGEISSIYPYKTPRDKNNEGKRYNLLPRVSKIDPITQVSSPKQPFGSFPIKEEIVTNIEFLDVYKKYYKYTALTNSAGDYMIFGVPTGTQIIHLSVDITDIGKYSMNPASMVTNLGYSPNLFTENGAKLKPSNDLDDLPNIETQEITVDIIPFWGDTTIFTIGITRQDFRIRAVLNNTFVIFGTAFTDGSDSMWGASYVDNEKIAELFSIRTNGENDVDRRINSQINISMVSKRIGKITEKIYYYPASVTDVRLDVPTAYSDVDPTTEMKVLEQSDYSVYKRDGDFVFIISCNRNKIITNEFGIDVSVPNDSPNGIFTKFRGFLTFEITPETIPMNFTGNISDRTTLIPFRYIYKFPQTSAPAYGFDSELPLYDGRNQEWRREHKVFSGGTIYSVAKFYATSCNNMSSNNNGQFPLTYPNKFFQHTAVNNANEISTTQNVGIIQTGISEFVTSIEQQQGFPSNNLHNNITYFGANWMNFCIYFPQVGWVTNGYAYINYVRFNDNFHSNDDGAKINNTFYVNDNQQPIAANEVNTKFFARSDLHWTDFIEVSKVDLIILNNSNEKGFKILNNGQLTGKYRNGDTPCPFDGGRFNGQPNGATDHYIYLYKGMGNANCIEYLDSLGI